MPWWNIFTHYWYVCDIPLGASSHPVPVRCGDGFCNMRHKLTWDSDVMEEETTTAWEQFCVKLWNIRFPCFHWKCCSQEEGQMVGFD